MKNLHLIQVYVFKGAYALFALYATLWSRKNTFIYKKINVVSIINNFIDYFELYKPLTYNFRKEDEYNGLTTT